MPKYEVIIWKAYVYDEIEAKSKEQAEDKVMRADGWRYDDVAKVEVKEIEDEN